jgi:hypothetical protein
MDKIYIILIEENNSFSVKGYNSFSRLCSENGIDKNSVDKKLLPFKVKNKTILSVEVDNRI